VSSACSGRYGWSMCVEAFDLSTAEVRSLDFVIKQILYETVQNHYHGNYSTMPDIFMFWIAECPAEKKTEKFRKKYNEYHYTHYDKLCKLLNILSVSLLSFSIVVYF